MTDTRVHILGEYTITGCFAPVCTRRLDGKFYTDQSDLLFARGPAPILNQHNWSRAGVIGWITGIWQDPDGWCMSGLLFNHPMTAEYWRLIQAGDIFFSSDFYASRQIVEPDGYIARDRLFGLSLCGLPYYPPDDMPLAEYRQLVETAAAVIPGATVKPVDWSIVAAPIPERRSGL
jgi:hypothetical protein